MIDLKRLQKDCQTLLSTKEILASNNNQAVQKFKSLPLKQQLELVLDATGKERIELMYHSDRFPSLVQAMPASEILFTLEEVGVDVALPIIAATNHEQFTFLTDFSCWNKDEINPLAIIEWLQILVECGEEKIQDWLAKVDPEWLILILKNLVNIYKCDDEGEPPNIQEADDLYTIDGIYYFDFLDSHSIDPLQAILYIFRDEDPDGFRGIMEAAIWTDLREMEIFASHFRQSRMSEWGFPEWDEAFQIYQYFTPAERKQVVHELEKGLREWTDLSTAARPLMKLSDGKGFLAICMKQVDDGKRTARFSQELVLLANKVQVADGMENFSASEKVRLASKKAMGYVTLGLAELSANDPLKAAELIGRVHTERLFQVGFSQVQDLARKARQLVESPGLIERIEPSDRAMLNGLLLPQPKYYSNDFTLSDDGLVDFHEPAQVQKCWDLLNQMK